MITTIIGVQGPKGLFVCTGKDEAIKYLQRQQTGDAAVLANWINTGTQLPASNKQWSVAYGEAEFCFK